jgi:hypothetical protein
VITEHPRNMLAHVTSAAAPGRPEIAVKRLVTGLRRGTLSSSTARGPYMYEMQGPRLALRHQREPIARLPWSCLADHRTGYPSGAPVTRLPGRSRGFPRERYPSLVVSEFLQGLPDLAQEVQRINFKILWPSTGRLKLSPALSGISTELSTVLSTARGIPGQGRAVGRRRAARKRLAVVLETASCCCRRRPGGRSRRTGAARRLPRSRLPREPRR